MRNDERPQRSLGGSLRASDRADRDGFGHPKAAAAHEVGYLLKLGREAVYPERLLGELGEVALLSLPGRSCRHDESMGFVVRKRVAYDAMIVRISCGTAREARQAPSLRTPFQRRSRSLGIREPALDVDRAAVLAVAQLKSSR